MGGYLSVGGGELDEDDVAKGFGGVDGYAYGCCLFEEGRVSVGLWGHGGMVRWSFWGFGVGVDVPLLPSLSSSTHSWSLVYFFSCATEVVYVSSGKGKLHQLKRNSAIPAHDTAKYRTTDDAKVAHCDAGRARDA